MSNTLRKVATAPEHMPGPANGMPTHHLTHNERVVLEALTATSVPLKAYELLDVLKDHGMRAPMTIYRALDGLIERGLAKKIISLNAFTAIDPGKPACGFMICRDCGAVEALAVEADDVTRLLGATAKAFDDAFIEIYGRCKVSACSNRPNRG